MGIFTKRIKILGRSKHFVIVGDLLFFALLAMLLNLFLINEITKLSSNKSILITRPTKKIEQTPDVVIKTPTCANPKFSSRAYYYDSFGDQIGIGPNPPIAGIPTNYWIFFEVISKDALKNINISAKTLNRDKLTGNKKISIGEFSYITSTGDINWKINELSKNQSATIAFEISITPKNSDIGKILDIIKDTQLVANDEYCKKEVTQTIPNLDTALQYDAFGKNNGKIKELK